MLVANSILARITGIRDGGSSQIFNGTESYTEARPWLIDYDRISREIGWEDTLRRRKAARHLKNEALNRWTQVRGENEEEASFWKNFKNQFETRFMSAIEIEIQLEKFICIKQKGSTLKEYINKFTELAKFERSLIDTPMKKAMKFVKGLNSFVKDLILA